MVLDNTAALAVSDSSSSFISSSGIKYIYIRWPHLDVLIRQESCCFLGIILVFYSRLGDKTFDIFTFMGFMQSVVPGIRARNSNTRKQAERTWFIRFYQSVIL